MLTLGKSTLASEQLSVIFATLPLASVKLAETSLSRLGLAAQVFTTSTKPATVLFLISLTAYDLTRMIPSDQRLSRFEVKQMTYSVKAACVQEARRLPYDGFKGVSSLSYCPESVRVRR
jgi:hypothetical protein